MEAWTGQLVGKMHINGIRGQDVAREAGISHSYFSQILNGKRNPDGMRERMEAAVERILEKRKAI